MVTTSKPCGVVNEGRTEVLFDGILLGSESHEVPFIVHADTIILSVYVRSVDSGDINISVETLHKKGEAAEVIDVPTLTAPSSVPVFRKAAVTLENCLLKIEHDDNCHVTVIAKGLSVGELSVALIGAAIVRTEKKITDTIPNTPELLLPAALVDRAGLSIKNWNNNGVIYWAESSAKLTAGKGFPLAPGEPFNMDLGAGQEIWVMGDKASMDVRVVEASI